MINLKKKFLIYGYGISGKSIENYFIYKNCKYDIYDDYKKIVGKKFVSKDKILKNLYKYDYFVVSPSVKIGKNHFLYKFKKQILIDLDFLSLELSSQKTIGITGTEGKSTICSYINEFLSKKYRSKIIGNFGDTILDKKNLKNFLSKIDFLIIELSSYQLDKVKFLKLDYALITNIFVDHLDYHYNFKSYIQSKFKIQNLLHDNSNLYLSRKLFLKYRPYIKINRDRLIFNEHRIVAKDNVTKHLKELNINLIKKLIFNIDTDLKIKNKILMNDLNYRNQLIYKSKNLEIYNDSKCTNLYNAIYKNNLIKSSKKILILGGKLKNQENLKLKISNTLVLLFGYDSNSFLNHLNFVNSKFYKFINLNDLINFLKLILKLHNYNYVIFSPGGESFDCYRDYIDRGKNFNKLIKKIIH